MDPSLTMLFHTLSLLGLAPAACLAEMEGGGIPVADALEAILDQPPGWSLTPGLAAARCGAGLAQARPALFGELARILARRGIHPMSLLNWDGWDPDLALDLLQRWWPRPGHPPLCLLGIGHVPCAELRLLPYGLRLQRLRLAQAGELFSLPGGLEVESSLELRDLGLRRIPDRLRCGGNLVLARLPRLEGWGEGIRIGGDLVLGELPRRAEPPADLAVGGRRRSAPGWDRPRPARRWW